MRYLKGKGNGSGKGANKRVFRRRIKALQNRFNSGISETDLDAEIAAEIKTRRRAIEGETM